MSGKKSAYYLFVSLCALSTLSINISDVNAKPDCRGDRHSSAFDNFGTNNVGPGSQTTTERSRDHGADIATGRSELEHDLASLEEGHNFAIAVVGKFHIHYPDNTSSSPSNIHQVNTGRQSDRYHDQVFVYEPPTIINFGEPDEIFPVYKEMLPQYVFDFRSSNNKYRRLLAGLALLNLGMISTSDVGHNIHNNFKTRPSESCTFIVKQDISKSDEMKIECKAITAYIPIYTSNKTETNVKQQSNQISSYGNSGAVTPEPVLAADDYRLDGQVFEPKAFSECFVTHKYQTSNSKTSVPCGLLEKYSVASLHLHDSSSAASIQSSLFNILASIVMFLF